MVAGESAAALYSGRPIVSMTHLVMAMSTWNDRIISTGGNAATTHRAEDRAQDRGQLGDDEGDVEHHPEGLVGAGAVQAEALDQPVDGVVAGGHGDAGDGEDAHGDRDDDDAAGQGDVSELGHGLLQVEGVAGERGRAWRRAARQRRCGGMWASGSAVDVVGAGSDSRSNRVGWSGPAAGAGGGRRSGGVGWTSRTWSGPRACSRTWSAAASSESRPEWLTWLALAPGAGS